MSYIPPSGTLDASWEGEGAYSRPIKFAPGWWSSDVIGVFPVGIADGSVGSPVVTMQQFAYPDGWPSSAFSASLRVTLDWEYPPPERYVDASWVGASTYTPPVWNALQAQWIPGGPAATEQFCDPAGFDAQAFGAPGVRNAHEYLTPTGFDAQAHGQSNVWNLNQHVLAGGITSKLAWGKPTVQNRDRYLTVPGFNAQLFGTQFVQGGVKQLLASGVPAPTQNQRPWLSFSPRWLTPVAIEAPGLPVPIVGGTRYLEPTGFEATAWGERIIPEARAIYPEGQALTLWGDARPWNYTSWVRPEPIKWQAEEQRWGQNSAWNWQRYVTQVNDEHVDQFGIWTNIENRNRVITHHSTAPGALPIPVVENGARALLPAGIEAPEYYKAGMVAYRVREFPIEGIEAPDPSYWLTVANGARVVVPAGFDAHGHGQPSLENNRRNFPYISGGDQQILGTPMVADRIRSITFESRYGIEPPSVPLPEVKLNTRYIEPAGYETYGTGGHELQIHWTIVTPRWTHREAAGTPEVRNVTPELPVYGHNSEEFGRALVRTQWRQVFPGELYSQAFGQATVADRRQVVQVGGTNALRVGDKLTVQNTLPDLPPPQWIVHHSPHGYTITPDEVIPVPQADHGMGEPICGAQSVRPDGIEADEFELMGKPSVAYMGINDAAVGPEEGIGFPTRPWVSLRVRNIVIESLPERPGGIAPANGYGNARLSPHTIYAVTEATEQAVANHPVNHGRRLHFVDCSPVTGEWLKGVGAPVVTLRNRTVRPYHNTSEGDRTGGMNRHGTPGIRNKQIVVKPPSIKAPAIIAPKLWGSSRSLQVSNQDGEHEFAPTPGTPWVSLGTRTLAPAGIAPATRFGTGLVDFYNRFVKPGGISSLAMGASGSSPRFMRQRLHVGAPDWPEIQGFDAQLFGTGWISNRVRGVEPEGFAGTAITHEFEAFHLRMRVTTEPTPGPATHTLGAAGFDALGAGVCNISNWVQYIRPDGNMDNYRKGAPT